MRGENRSAQRASTNADGNTEHTLNNLESTILPSASRNSPYRLIDSRANASNSSSENRYAPFRIRRRTHKNSASIPPNLRKTGTSNLNGKLSVVRAHRNISRPCIDRASSPASRIADPPRHRIGKGASHSVPFDDCRRQEG